MRKRQDFRYHGPAGCIPAHSEARRLSRQAGLSTEPKEPFLGRLQPSELARTLWLQHVSDGQQRRRHAKWRWGNSRALFHNQLDLEYIDQQGERAALPMGARL